MPLTFQLPAKKKLCLLIALLAGSAASSNAQDSIRIPVSEFDPSQLEEDYEDPKWSVLKLPNRKRTEYALIDDESGPSIRASSQSSASGLVYAVSIDPNEYPVLEWTWKVNAVIEKGDLRKKSGDDYPARIYLTFDFDPARLSFLDRVKYTLIKTFTRYEIPLRALNYVWANKATQGTIAPNPYTSWVQMVAVQSGNGNASEWQTERVNILENYREAFGEEPMSITGVAIMTDSDDTKSAATGYYQDIVFLKALHEAPSRDFSK